MAIAANFPTIRPTLNLDFVNSRTVDPRITFTRASTATFYDGRTFAKAEENLLLNSRVPLGTGWAGSDGQIGSLGSELVANGDFSEGTTGWSTTGTATINVVGGRLEVSGGNPYVDVGNQIILLTAGVTYWFSAYIESGARIEVAQNFGSGSAVGRYTNNGASGVCSIYFTVPVSGPHLLRLFRWNRTTALFDDVSLRQMTADNVTAPDGTATAATATALAANATFTQAITAIAGDYTFSVWLRRKTGTGTVEITAGSGTWVAQTITSSWARYSVTQTLAAGSRSPGVRITTANDEVEIWGAQLEQRSTATAYTPTTDQPITRYVPQLMTAAANVPRIDFDPITGACRGLLIEEQRTNLLLRSSEFDNAYWTKNYLTVTANAAVAPDGTTTADKLVLLNGTVVTGNDGKGGTSAITTVTSGVTYTYSVYAKAAEFTSIIVREGITTGARASVNLITGEVIYQFGSPSQLLVTATNVGNGWWRIFCTRTSTATSFLIEMKPGSTGDGTSGIYIWGAQLEAGAFATSYIPTGASQVTRSADSAVMTGTNFSSWYRQDAGTLFVESSRVAAMAANTPLVILDGPNTNLIRIRADSFVYSFDGFVNAASQFSLNTVSVNDRAALAYAANNVIGSTAGAVTSADTSCLMPSVVNTMAIGQHRYNSNRFNGHIRRIAYYNQRLTNAQLQAITA